MKSLAAFLFTAFTGVTALAYDPLAAPKKDQVIPQDLTVKDDARQREIPMRVYLPEGKSPAPVVLFSHGLGGSRENSPYLGQHWAARGYAVVFMQHAGSDANVWKNTPPAERMAALKGAASLQSLTDRVRDVPAVLDQLDRWNKGEGHALSGRLDLARVGMCGHSFGAVTTQAVSGQSSPLTGQRFSEARIKAALPMSPSTPRKGVDPAKAFGTVKIPWLLMTGTLDDSPIGETSPESRLKVFPALPPGDKYELVLDGAQHSAFGDRPLPGDTKGRNPNHHRAILALSTAFWDAYLRDDADAKKWLNGDEPKTVLEKADRWQKK
jgi:predicted dienelactone hydrolase